jgi:hypothetical protein
VWVYIIAGTLISTEVWNRKGDHSQTAMPQRASYMLRHTRVRAKYKQQRQRCVLSQTTALRSIYSERVSGVTDDGDFSRTECLSILCCYSLLEYVANIAKTTTEFRSTHQQDIFDHSPDVKLRPSSHLARAQATRLHAGATHRQANGRNSFTRQ